jgi:Arc/MetJ-type ribon-helix-helix transcriptional regulator
LADWQAEHAARVAAEADVQVARGQYQGACDVIRKLEFQLTILCEQGRQHQAFQEWTNQTEALRLNDARREGWKAHAANGRLVLPAVTFDYRAGILDGSSGKTEQYDEGFCDGVKAMRDHIRAMQPPTEWVNPPATLTNEGAKWPHPDGFAGGLMGETG